MNADVIKILKSSNAVIVVLVLALLAQMPHAHYVLYNHSREQDWFGWGSAFVGAVALEIAVLVFTVRGNVRVSWGFAAFSVCVNLIYYYDTTASLYTPTNWLLSAGLPVAIALYSHEVVEQPEQPQAEHKPNTKRVTRTVRAVQSIEASEQYDEQPAEHFAIVEPKTVQAIEQPAALIDEQPTMIDLSSMSSEQKKVYALQVVRSDPNVNKSALMKQLDVSRSTFYGWMK